MLVRKEKLTSPGRYKVDAVVQDSDGHVYVITTINTKARQVVLTGQIGNTLVYKDDEFRNAIAKNELKLVVRTENRLGVDEIFEPRPLSPTEIRSRDERKEYIDVVVQYIDTYTWEGVYNQIKMVFSDRKKLPSRRTIERYWKKYKSAHSPNCLAANFSARGVHRSLSLDPIVEEIILDTLEVRYCSSHRYSIQDIVHEINQRCDAKSLELKANLGGVSRRTIGRFISRLSLKDIKGRLSSSSYRLLVRNALSYHDVFEPYARIEADSTPLDILVVDKRGNILGTPTFYAMIDTASMTIVGVFLTIQPPSQVGVLETLKFAFSPKGEDFRRQHGCKHEWPAPADFRTLVMDNGSDFHGPMVVKAAQHLSMTLEYCVKGSPYQKPFIERFFRTIEDMLISKLPGAKNSQDEREEHALENAMKAACMTVDELNTAIIRWITDTYHMRTSERLSMKFDIDCTPHQALDILSQKHVVFPAPSAEELVEACRHILNVKVKVTREGINYQRQQYQAEYVSDLFKTNAKVTVDVCINPLDCSYIHIFDVASQQWIVVPNKNPNMPAISFEQAKHNRANRYKSDLELSREEHVLNQMQIIEQANAKKSRKGRVGDNRKAERQIENAEASIRANAQPSQAPVPTPSPEAPQTAAQPHRRKK